MSNFRAVATVTTTLQRILQSAIQSDVPGATVSTVRPGDQASAHLPTTGINLFLYQITPNPHRAGDDLPTRRPDGGVVQRPVAPFELHYLMSCYGNDLTLEPQRVLGSALAFLHAQPQLTRAQIQAAVGDPATPFLAASDLADQVDLVRFTPTSLTLDELSRLWSVFLQTQYVLSTTFRAATVLLERQITPHPALPTRAVQVAAVPFQPPRIDRIVSAAGESTPIIPGSTIVIEGANLIGAATIVEIDGNPAPVTTAEATRVTLALPAPIAAGPHTLLVRQAVAFGATTRPAFASGIAAFVVQPVITKTAGNPDIAVTNVQGAGAAPRSATVTVGVAPPVGVRQSATLELLAGPLVAFRFPATPLAAPASQLGFAVTGVTSGDYLFVVRIDGAASPLETDANGVPTGPKGTIP